MDPSQDQTMISSLLKLKARLDFIISESFQNSELFVHASKDTFKICINKRQNKPAELCAKFIDRLLKTNKGMTDKELDYMLDQCLELFRLIEGKDLFEAFYGKDLAKRLLLSKSASVEAEKSMLSKLKVGNIDNVNDRMRCRIY
jgi:cullin-4